MLPIDNDTTIIHALVNTVYSEKNYYFMHTPDSDNFRGPVDWSPYLTTDIDMYVGEPGCGYGVGGSPPICDTCYQNKIAVESPLPRAFSLAQNYPNPFNPATVIQYYLPAESKVSLRVYNILGQVVRTLVNGPQPGGDHFEAWDGHSDGGAALASGVYLYRLQTDNGIYTRKMVLLK